MSNVVISCFLVVLSGTFWNFMLLFGIFCTIWVFWAFYAVLLRIWFVVIYALFRVKLFWLKPCLRKKVVFLHLRVLQGCPAPCILHPAPCPAIIQFAVSCLLSADLCGPMYFLYLPTLVQRGLVIYANPARGNSAPLQNPPIGPTSLYITITFECRMY